MPKQPCNSGTRPLRNRHPLRVHASKYIRTPPPTLPGCDGIRSGQAIGIPPPPSVSVAPSKGRGGLSHPLRPTGATVPMACDGAPLGRRHPRRPVSGPASCRSESGVAHTEREGGGWVRRHVGRCGPACHTDLFAAAGSCCSLTPPKMRSPPGSHGPLRGSVWTTHPGTRHWGLAGTQPTAGNGRRPGAEARPATRS